MITTRRWIQQHAEPMSEGLSRFPWHHAKIVVLGVSARDTHELSVAAHQIIRFLVEHHGFRSLALEGDDAASAALDEYVRTGRGDPQATLAAARIFWRTGELLDTVRWIRHYNEEHPGDPVRIAHPDGSTRPVLRRTGSPGAFGDLEHLLAENTVRWHEHTGHKIVYWGGNAHTVRGLPVFSPSTSTVRHHSLGSYLREHFGDAHISLGLTFHHGSTSVAVPPPPDFFAESTLSAAGPGTHFFSLRDPMPEPVRAWLTGPATMRMIGPDYEPENDAAYHLTGGSLAEWFDAVVHSHTVTSVRHLDDGLLLHEEPRT